MSSRKFERRRGDAASLGAYAGLAAGWLIALSLTLAGIAVAPVAVVASLFAGGAVGWLVGWIVASALHAHGDADEDR